METIPERRNPNKIIYMPVRQKECIFSELGEVLFFQSPRCFSGREKDRQVRSLRP